MSTYCRENNLVSGIDISLESGRSSKPAHVLAHLVLAATPHGWDYYYARFGEEELKVSPAC